MADNESAVRQRLASALTAALKGRDRGRGLGAAFGPGCDR